MEANTGSTLWLHRAAADAKRGLPMTVLSTDCLPGCAVCEKQPSAACPHDYCGFRDFCRDRDDRREIARIMALSESDLAAEVTRDGETPESVAAKCRAIFERACAIVDGRVSYS